VYFFLCGTVTQKRGDGEMVGVVVVTHCHLAEELIAAAELVVGENLKQFQPVSIDPKEGSEEIREKIISAIRKVDEGKGILILTDMYGGTPSNISLSFLEEKKIEVITGVNLPMLLKLATYQNDMDFEALAIFITDYGQRNIHLASEVLKKRVDKKKSGE
jgi:PTS system mannose-specific IIA component